MQPALAFSCANQQQGLCGERHGSVAESLGERVDESLPRPPCFLFVTITAAAAAVCFRSSCWLRLVLLTPACLTGGSRQLWMKRASQELCRLCHTWQPKSQVWRQKCWVMGMCLCVQVSPTSCPWVACLVSSTCFKGKLEALVYQQFQFRFNMLTKTEYGCHVFVPCGMPAPCCLVLCSC